MDISSALVDLLKSTLVGECISRLLYIRRIFSAGQCLGWRPTLEAT